MTGLVLPGVGVGVWTSALAEEAVSEEETACTAVVVTSGNDDAEVVSTLTTKLKQ